MRNDAAEGEEKDPIDQALTYLERVRDRQAKTSNGLLIPNYKDVPGFCYILCDLTSTMLKRCKNWDLTVKKYCNNRNIVKECKTASY